MNKKRFPMILLAVLGTISAFAPFAFAELNRVFDLIRKGDLESLRLVPISRIRELEVPQPNGVPPLGEAALCGESDIVAWLLSTGSDPNGRSFSNLTPLHLAVMNGKASERVIHILLKNGANPNLRNEFSQTPLMAAALYQPRSDHIERILLPLTTVTDDDLAFLGKFARQWQRDGGGEKLENLIRKIALIRVFRRK